MQNEIAIDQLVAEMSGLIAEITLAEAENKVVPRFNQPKTVAYVDAEFSVHDDIPEELKHGIFARPNTYPTKIRFANATNKDDSSKDLRGLSMRLSNVDGLGPVLWGEPSCQDFILNSHPALFVATPEEFLDFIRARKQGIINKLLFFLTHLKSFGIILKSKKRHLSPLDIRYWSTVPFRLGDNLVVKYSVIPCSDYETTEAVNAGEHQLRAAIKAHLQQSPARFHLAVQKQIDPESMPIEDASVVWDEDVSPFIPVATITVEDQEVDNNEILANGERCSFNPWQCLAAHEPLGRMNQVRRMVYAKAAELRNRNKE
jgi:catalase